MKRVTKNESLLIVLQETNEILWDSTINPIMPKELNDRLINMYNSDSEYYWALPENKGKNLNLLILSET